MATDAKSSALAGQARRLYVDSLFEGMPAVVQAIDNGARTLLSEVADPALVLRRRELVEDLSRNLPKWLENINTMLGRASRSGLLSAIHPDDLPAPSGRNGPLTLVENATIEGEILSSRLALAMMDRASWEFTDLRSRMASLEGQGELAASDVLRPHVLSRIVIMAWQSAGMGHDHWKTLQSVLHREFAQFAEEAYHEMNRWLVERRVLPEIDLRPFIRKAREGAVAPSSPSSAAAFSAEATNTHFDFSNVVRRDGGGGGGGGGGAGAGGGGGAGGSGPTTMGRGVGDESRLMTRNSPLVKGERQAQMVLGRLNRLIGRQLPEFASTAPVQQDAPPVQASPVLASAMVEAQQNIAQRFSPGAGSERTDGAALSTPAMLEELQQRKQVLKQAATTPVERATIEIVALLFQSLLVEEKLPATVRVWFARLQMPVLRVAIAEPDFFAATDHPARRLIDRMGGCVMGFSGAVQAAGDQIEKEIKRVVQVIEAYPDTGRRVFQTVLTEFEKFLENYFQNDNAASRQGVSLAQQVELRETMAIQYTIELRKMLAEVPVPDGIREFLFHVWADVLAMTAARDGKQSDGIKKMKRAAADLIWSAGAKTSREERTAVLRRLPPLLKLLREGMQGAGVSAAKQDENIQRLNEALTAAFTARTAAISAERLEELAERLETLEELLPDAEEIEIDEAMVMNLSGHESADLEVVADGGSMPTPAMLAWAKELQVGAWFMLDYRNRNEAMQLAWQGMRKQLSLFVSPQGRGVLFQQNRLASFLQAGLLLPAEEESLTTRATRGAIAKLDADPERLLK